MKTSKQVTLDLLRAYESRNVTFIDPDGSWPIVWERAKGETVWDAEGKRYLDLTAAFGVAASGHANPRVVAAGRRQMGRLLHAMGDVHPHALKARLAQELSRITFERWHSGAREKSHGAVPERGKTIFCSSGFEAVEAALKTAKLATGRPGVIAFEGGYHGLGYGALNTTHRAHFRSPFLDQLARFGTFVPFPAEADNEAATCRKLEKAFKTRAIGAVLVEPVQVRGGINLPPKWLLPMLQEICDRHRALLIFDEIYTGFGRTGRWFACEHWRTAPDLVCLGKALTGGFPLSACVGRAPIMDAAWPVSTGEAIHTSTFLGHPVGCAMAVAQIEEIRAKRLVQASQTQGRFLLRQLQQLAEDITSKRKLRVRARGLGLLAGLELIHPDGAPATEETISIIKALLKRGFILLPEGEFANVISFTPPLTISQRQLLSALAALRELLLEPAHPVRKQRPNGPSLKVGRAVPSAPPPVNRRLVRRTSPTEQVR